MSGTRIVRLLCPENGAPEYYAPNTNPDGGCCCGCEVPCCLCKECWWSINNCWYNLKIVSLDHDSSVKADHTARSAVHTSAARAVATTFEAEAVLVDSYLRMRVKSQNGLALSPACGAGRLNSVRLARGPSACLYMTIAV